jgi:hypothetical protein
VLRVWPFPQGKPLIPIPVRSNSLTCWLNPPITNALKPVRCSLSRIRMFGCTRRKQAMNHDHIKKKS